MDDERLASELERRARATSPRPDWARRDLLPAVWREIDARPQPVLTSRWSPRLGLAAVVAALLIMVVAVPRLVPAPPTSSSSPTEGTSPEPNRTSVLSTAEFASRLAAGDLSGETVLVNGRIVPNIRLGPLCPLSQDDLCYVGTLEGAGVGVYARPLPTMEGEDALRLVVGPSSWPWWNHNWASADNQILLLSIDAAKQVEYIGSVQAAEDGLMWTVSKAETLDINSLSVDTVVLIDGWLSGQGGAPSCPAVEPEPLSGLPSRGCVHPAWISDFADDDGSTALHVQNGAYFDFAPNPPPDPMAQFQVEPQLGTYALARRLEGWGCPAVPPCWQWNVVARLDTAMVPMPSPTAEPTDPPPTPTPLSGDGYTSSRCGHAVVVLDHAGVVDGCAEMYPTPAEQGVQVLSEPNRISVSWLGSACASDTIVQVLGWEGGYVLDVSEHDRIDEGCRPPNVPRAIYIDLRQDVASDSISARLNDSTLADGIPLPPADAPRATSPVIITCTTPTGEEFGWNSGSGKTFRDVTGLVASCEAVHAPRDTNEVTLTNPDHDQRTLRIVWSGSPCDGLADFDLAQSGSQLVLRMSRYGMVCIMPRVLHAIDVHLTDDVVAGDLILEFAGAELPDAQLPPGAGAAWWDIAPDERPTHESTELRLIVHERACAGGHSPEGRVQDPTISYSETSISVSYTVTTLSGEGDCPAAPGAEVTLTLSEPLGSRSLVDRLALDTVFEWTDDGLPEYWTNDLAGTISSRTSAYVGAGACRADVIYDRHLPSNSELEQMAADLGRFRGWVDDHRAYMGSAEDAAREFGAIEIYQDGRSADVMILAPATGLPGITGTREDTVALVNLTGFWIRDGRQIWYPGFYQAALFTPAPCSDELGESPRPSLAYVPDQVLVSFCESPIDDPDGFAAKYALALDHITPQPDQLYVFRILDGTDPVDKVAEVEPDPWVCLTTPNWLGELH